MSERILITGVYGFLGSAIARLACRAGYSVFGVGRKRKDSALPLPPEVVTFGLTLPDPYFAEIVRQVKPTVVIHAAGSSLVSRSVEAPYEDFEKSVLVAASVFETLRLEAPQCYTVLLSSAAVYGEGEQLPIKEESLLRPVSPYGFHKRMCEVLHEEYIRFFGLNGAIVRIFSAYGAGLRKQVIFDTVKKISLLPAGGTLSLLGTGRETRDFIHADDIAQALFCCLKNRSKGVFNIASGQQTSIRSVVESIAAALNKQVTLSFAGEVNQGYPEMWQADISRLRALGFQQQISLNQGIEEVVSWYRSQS